MRAIFFSLLILLFSQSLWAKENSFISKKNIIIIGLTIANPAIVLGTIVTNAGALKKTISMVNIAYSVRKGKTLAEGAISKSTNKDCMIKNLAEEKSFCS